MYKLTVSIYSALWKRPPVAGASEGFWSSDGKQMSGKCPAISFYKKRWAVTEENKFANKQARAGPRCVPEQVKEGGKNLQRRVWAALWIIYIRLYHGGA